MDKEKCPLCELGRNLWNLTTKPEVIEENKYDDDFYDVGVNIQDGRLYFDNSSGTCKRDFVLINYCPMCGKKLCD